MGVGPGGKVKIEGEGRFVRNPVPVPMIRSSRTKRVIEKIPTNAELVPKPDRLFSWKEYDKESYLKKGRLNPDQDKYKKNQFNQEASDNASPDRDVPDSREYK